MKNKTYLKVLQDINDGKDLRNWNSIHFGKGTDFPLQMFVDGVSPFKNSKLQLVPVFLTNLQIPLEDRFKLSNMILVALLSSKNTEIDYPFFLDELVKELNPHLEHFKITLGETEFDCEADVLNLVMDISEKEKALLLRFY